MGYLQRLEAFMFIFDDNDQIKKELKKIIIDAGSTQKDISDMLGVKPQQYTNIIKKENLAFKDVKKILDCIGYDLVIDFVKKTEAEKG